MHEQAERRAAQAEHRAEQAERRIEESQRELKAAQQELSDMRVPSMRGNELEQKLLDAVHADGLYGVDVSKGNARTSSWYPIALGRRARAASAAPVATKDNKDNTDASV